MNIFEEYECLQTRDAGNAIEFTVGRLVGDEGLSDSVATQFKFDYEAEIRKYLDSGTGVVEVRVGPRYYCWPFPMYSRTGTHIHRDPLTNLWARYNIGTSILTARCRVWRDGGVIPDALILKSGERLAGLPESVNSDRGEDYLGFGRSTDDETLAKVKKYVEDEGLIWEM